MEQTWQEKQGAVDRGNGTYAWPDGTISPAPLTLVALNEMGSEIEHISPEVIAAVYRRGV